jgi:hypothetical protein
LFVVKVIPKWWELMKPVYAQDKGDIQADMYAYVLAAAHHKMKHVRLNNYMVSCVDCGEEGWPWIDKMKKMSCEKPIIPEGFQRPSFLHAASHFKACTEGDTHPYEAVKCNGDSDMWNFHKGHVPSQILECDQPLLQSPPDELFDAQTSQKGRRSAFMVCALTYTVNRAALEYKRKFCPGNYNQKKCVRMVVAHSQAGRCKSKGNPSCYPLAKVVC